MAEILLYQVDAFTSELFGGNPAAVCPLDDWLPDATMQAIAAENALSETAFFVPRDDRFELRWFTPAVEVDLCGHATLATAYVVLSELTPELEAVPLWSPRSGSLPVERQGELFVLDFPARPSAPVEGADRVAGALGADVIELRGGRRDLLAVLESEEVVRDLEPDMRALAALGAPVIATAPGRDADFVSRFFAPGLGVPEDPVTGSAHCALAPYWAERLGRDELGALQLSRRGGEVHCRVVGERVLLGGRAVLYMRGTLFL